jgi:ribosomal protein L40E
MEIFVGILIFIAVMVLAAILFAGWIFVVMVRFMVNAVGGIGRWFFAPSSAPARVVQGRKVKLVRCRNQGCGAGNPSVARFCRRCGTPMEGATRVVARRAAVL